MRFNEFSDRIFIKFDTPKNYHNQVILITLKFYFLTLQIFVLILQLSVKHNIIIDFIRLRKRQNNSILILVILIIVYFFKIFFKYYDRTAFSIDNFITFVIINVVICLYWKITIIPVTTVIYVLTANNNLLFTSRHV